MEQRGRLQFLDALRGLAILGVVFVHVSQLPGEPALLSRLGGWGARGVQLFFIVSAITLLTVDKETGYAQFLLRRFFRIAPMFYLGIGLYLIIYGTGPRFFAPSGIGPIDVALTFAFLHGWTLNSADSVVPGGWSIGCEAMFYLFFPMFVKSINTWRRSILFVVVSGIISIFTYVLVPHLVSGPASLVRSFSYFLFPAQLLAFAVGFLVFYLFPELRRLSWAPKVARIAIPTILVVIVALAFANTELSRLHLIGDLLLGSLVLCVGVSPPRWLVNPIMAHIGLVSFSVYIIHFALVEAARPWVSEQPLLAELAFPTVLIVSICAATLTYRFVEQPMVRLGRRASDRIPMQYAEIKSKFI